MVAGAGAFGWVGLYLALVAEIGGARYAGLLTGVAVAFSWSGVLIRSRGGPRYAPHTPHRSERPGEPVPLLDHALALTGIGVAVAITLPRPRPLVQRD